MWMSHVINKVRDLSTTHVLVSCFGPWTGVSDMSTEIASRPALSRAWKRPDATRAASGLEAAWKSR
jgi:hypothetical protein